MSNNTQMNAPFYQTVKAQAGAVIVSGKMAPTIGQVRPDPSGTGIEMFTGSGWMQVALTGSGAVGSTGPVGQVGPTLGGNTSTMPTFQRADFERYAKDHRLFVMTQEAAEDIARTCQEVAHTESYLDFDVSRRAQAIHDVINNKLRANV